MKGYLALKKQIFKNGDYSIIPIRMEDRLMIMEWRNQQIYHLRQSKALTSKDQDRYFDEVVGKLFEKNEPDQILFSYMSGDKCIGYGGLVHINWIDKHAEISFVMDTMLEKDAFGYHWQNYLELIEKVGFDELKLHKIYTYAFDIRPQLYPALESKNFSREAILRDHCYIDDEYKDVVIHSKFNKA